MNDSVNVRITAEDAGATAAVANFEQKLTQVEQAYKRGTVAGQENIAMLDRLEKTAAGVGTTMELFGMESAGAAQHVRLMGTALHELEAAMGPLLVVMVALEAAFKGFQFLKEGVKDAADMQTQMETLGAAVKAQGGDWESDKESVEAWASSTTMATGVLKSDLIPALNTLVTAGMNVHDAELTMSVAAEVSRAKHVELKTVVDALISAEAGRGMGLVHLDTNLKAVVHSHGKLSDALKILHHDMGGSITDADDYQMSQKRLAVEIQAVGESLGKFFIPYLTEGATDMLGMIKVAEQMADGMRRSFRSIIDAAQALGEALAQIGKGHLTLSDNGDVGWSGSDFSRAKALMDQSRADSDVGGAQMGSAFNQDFYEAGHAAAQKAIHDFNSRLSSGIKLDHDVDFGNARGGHSGGGHHGAGHHGSGHHGAHGKSAGPEFNFKGMEDQLKPAKASLDAFQLSLDKLPKTVDGFNEAISRLNTKIAAEKKTQDELNEQQKIAHDRYEALLKIYNDFGASLGKHPSKQEKQELADLAAQVHGAKGEYDTLTVSINTNAAALKHHQEEVIRDSAEMQRQLDTIAKAHEAAYNKMHSEAEKYANETIAFFEKMGKSGKGIFHDLEDAFKAMIDNMIKKFIESKLTDLFMKFMGGGGASAANAAMPLGMLFTGGGYGAGPGAGAASLVTSSAGQSMAVHVTGMDSALSSGGGVGGMFAGLSPMMGAGLALGAGVGIGGLVGGAEGHQNGARNGMIGGALGVAGGALLASSGALAGLGIFGFGGGMMGGLAALGPYGILAAALLGGAAGGMFGGPKMNVTNNPDQLGGNTFAQGVANAQGTAYTQATGWVSQNNAAQFGGQTELGYIDAFVKAHPGGQGLTGNDLAMWNQANSLTQGGSAISEHGLSNGNMGLSSSMDPSAPTFNTQNWQALQTAIDGAANGIKGLGASASSAAAAVFTITRTYPDFNAAVIAGGGATVGGLPGTVGTNPGDGGVGGVPGGGSGGGSTGGSGHGSVTRQMTEIHVHIAGSVVGPGGISDVATAISQELAKRNRGQSFGSAGVTRNFGS